ncbi:MAG: hypothetical protein ACLSV2_15750 [Clostridium sp.]
MRRLKRNLVIISLVISSLLISACGIRGNNDFDYMQERNIMKVTIQSTRDKSYKFTVTDEDVINDIYNILSSASVVEEKSTLDPDYTLEIYESPTEVKTFNYIAGLDKKDGGNLYNDSDKYIVSKRLDNDIIKNFANIRRPINFEYIYYTSILNTVDKYLSDNKNVGKIGVNISDTMAERFQISTEIEEFKKKLNKLDSVSFMDSSESREDFDVVMRIKTEGYTSTKYKGIVTFEKTENASTVNYYISNIYEQGDWKFNISDKKPEGF